MTVFEAYQNVPLRGERDSRKLYQQLLFGAAAVATLAVAGVVLVRNVPFNAPQAVTVPPVAQPAPAARVSASDFGAMIVEPGWIPVRSNRDVTTLASLPAPFPGMAPLPPLVEAASPSARRLPDIVPMPPERDVPEIADSIPFPPARPSGLGSEPDAAPPSIASAPAPHDNGNLFQKFLGALSQPPARPAAPPPVASLAPGPPVTAPPQAAAPAPVVASAAAPSPDSRASAGRGGQPPLFPFFEKIFGHSEPPSGYDQYTAVYDISGKVLYMPDGTRIEAHSGLGAMIDDPRHVQVRAQGATPPHLYQLTMRESLFHGVQAIRLNPVGGEGGVYGRAGLLAHPYMLGPNGDSNGCVSVRDYDAFLRAFQTGQIKRLAVVANL